MSMTKGLRISLILMGIFFILLSIVLNQIFYNSLAGDNAVYQYAYSSIGIGLDVSKVLILILGVFLIAHGGLMHVIAGGVSIVIYAGLFILSLIAGWGFSLVVADNYENNKQQSSVHYQNSLSNMQLATDNLTRLAEYSSLSVPALESQMQSELAKQVQNSSGANAGTLDARTSGCTNTGTYYYQYCNQYNDLSQQIEYAKQYQAALAQKKLAESDFNNLQSGGVSQVVTHPVFTGLAAIGIFGETPEIAKLNFLFVSFLLVEIIGAFFFAVGSLFKNGGVLTVDEMQHAIKNITATAQMYEQFRNDQLAMPSSIPKTDPMQ